MDRTPGPLLRFFWFCSGANTRILALCPQSEHNRFAGIGATVFFTGLLAAFSGGYALYTAFNSYPLAILLGILWGCIIFNLDRFMVSSIKKDGSFRQQLGQAVPRFLLAIVLAMVISKPLELRIFEPEIIEVLEERRLNKLALIEDQFAEKKKAQEEKIAGLLDRAEVKLAMREQYYQDYRCECDGTCGTGKVGRGTECERKEQKYLQINEEYLTLKAQIDREVTEVQAEIAALKGEEDYAFEQANDVFSYGLVARLSASGELPTGPKIMIPLLILLIEISPILAKLLSPPGPYEIGLQKAEEAFVINQQEALEEQRIRSESKHELIQDLSRAEREQQVRQKEQALHVLSQAQLSLVKEQIEQWLNQEKEKLRKN